MLMAGADLGLRGMSAPGQFSFSFHFHAVSRKSLSNWLAPPLGNPGSVTAWDTLLNFTFSFVEFNPRLTSLKLCDFSSLVSFWRCIFFTMLKFLSWCFIWSVLFSPWRWRWLSWKFLRVIGIVIVTVILFQIILFYCPLQNVFFQLLIMFM